MAKQPSQKQRERIKAECRLIQNWKLESIPFAGIYVPPVKGLYAPPVKGLEARPIGALRARPIGATEPARTITVEVESGGFPTGNVHNIRQD